MARDVRTEGHRASLEVAIRKRRLGTFGTQLQPDLDWFGYCKQQFFKIQCFFSRSAKLKCKAEVLKELGQAPMLLEEVLELEADRLSKQRMIQH